MSGYQSDKQLERDALIMMRRMGKSAGHLEPSAAAAGPDQWQLMVSRNSYRKHVARVSDDLVRWAASRGWLVRDPAGCWRLSATGSDRLRAGTMQTANGFAEQHQIRTLQNPRPGEDTPNVAVTVNQTESPLGWLKGRKNNNGEPFLCSYHFEAADRLRSDFEAAALSPRVTASWDFTSSTDKHARASGTTRHMTDTERAMAAKARVNKALDAVGNELADMLLQVCCLSAGLEAAERALGWPRRSGKFLLRLALDRLAEHYKLGPAGGLNRRSGQISSWRADGYRPPVTRPDPTTHPT